MEGSQGAYGNGLFEGGFEAADEQTVLSRWDFLTDPCKFLTKVLLAVSINGSQTVPVLVLVYGVAATVMHRKFADSHVPFPVSLDAGELDSTFTVLTGDSYV